jgi:hypothetical protein
MTDKDFQLIRDLIEEAISEFHCPPCEEEEWLTTKQTRKALSISEPKLRGMQRQGEIRSIRVGQAYRYQLPYGYKSSPDRTICVEREFGGEW